MEFNKIAIVGVGLIGGSIALAIKKRGHRCRITGIGRNEKRLIRAEEIGIIDEYSTSPSDGVKGAEMVILATPVGQFERIVNEIKRRLKNGAIVTDVGSVKAEVVKRLHPLMPEGVSFVGAHPIAGSESSGMESATADLFDGTKCIITPDKHTSTEAIEVVSDLWRAIGSEVLFMSPEEHDSIYAAVSHMPHVIAYTLINTILDIDGILPYGGNGLRDMTRIAMSPVEIWRDICAYNRNNILNVLKSFSSSISHIVDLIERSDWSSLEREFEKARRGRRLIESD